MIDAIFLGFISTVLIFYFSKNVFNRVFNRTFNNVRVQPEVIIRTDEDTLSIISDNELSVNMN